jgi:hypothetical protein
MITNKNALFDLARCLENGYPDANDSVLDIARTVLPTIDLQAPLQAPVPTLNITEQANSIHSAAQFSVIAASGAVFTQLTALKKGLWRFYCNMTLATNYTVGAAAFSINLGNYGNGNVILGAMVPGGAVAAPIAQTSNFVIECLIPTDGVTINVVMTNNAAGQSAIGQAGVTAIHLL